MTLVPRGNWGVVVLFNIGLRGGWPAAGGDRDGGHPGRDPGALLDVPRQQQDQKIIRTVKDDLGSWNLRRLVWVADRGFASAANRAYLSRGGGHYIHAEKLRGTNAEAAAALARQGRYHEVAGNLRVKEVWVPARDAGERAERFVVCHNPEQAERDRAVRGRLIAHLADLIDGSDAWTPAGATSWSGR